MKKIFFTLLLACALPAVAALPKPDYVIPPEMPQPFKKPISVMETESPTCLYDNSRFSEGAVVSVDKKHSIQCANKKDSKDRTVAIWNIIK